MRCVNKFAALFCMVIWIIGTLPASAQEQAVVRWETNWPEATAYADSVRLGPAQQEPFRVRAGQRQLRLVPPSERSWSVAPIDTSLQLAPGDTVSVALRFPYHYRITSTPPGAEAYQVTTAGRKRLGRTPLVYETHRPLDAPIEVTAPGYETAVVDEPGAAIWNQHEVALSSLPATAQAASEVDWSPPDRPRTWIDVAAVGGALAAGALAVHYKFKADDIYQQYREGGPRQGDEALRARFEKYDRHSAIALGAMQVGLTVFAVRLALR